MMTANTTARPINRCRSKRPLSEKAKVTPRLNEGRTLFGKPRSGFLRSRDLRSMGRRRTAIAAADHLKQYRLGKVRLILGCLDRQHQSEPDPAEMLNATAPRRGSGCPTDFSNGQTSAALQPDPRCRRRGSWRPGTFRRGRDTKLVVARNRWFESISLQRRVVRTMVTAATWSRTAIQVLRAWPKSARGSGCQKRQGGGQRIELCSPLYRNAADRQGGDQPSRGVRAQD